MLAHAVFFTALASVGSFVAGIICPPRLVEAAVEVILLSNKVSLTCLPNISKRECKEMTKNNADVKNAFERYKVEQATPTSLDEYDLALSNAVYTATCLSCTIALGYWGRGSVKKIADKYQLPYSEAISRVVSAAFASLIGFYFMQSYPINAMQCVFLVVS